MHRLGDGGRSVALWTLQRDGALGSGCEGSGCAEVAVTSLKQSCDEEMIVSRVESKGPFTRMAE